MVILVNMFVHFASQCEHFSAILARVVLLAVFESKMFLEIVRPSECLRTLGAAEWFLA